MKQNEEAGKKKRIDPEEAVIVGRRYPQREERLGERSGGKFKAGRNGYPQNRRSSRFACEVLFIEKQTGGKNL